MTTTITEPKALATCVRQLLEMSRCLNDIADVLRNMGDDTTPLWGSVSRSSEEILAKCMHQPGIRIAVFPLEDKEAK